MIPLYTKIIHPFVYGIKRLITYRLRLRRKPEKAPQIVNPQRLCCLCYYYIPFYGFCQPFFRILSMHINCSDFNCLFRAIPHKNIISVAASRFLDASFYIITNPLYSPRAKHRDHHRRRAYKNHLNNYCCFFLLSV